MTDLITRLEQAEAGSRELDALITVAVTGGSDPKPDGHYEPRGADFWFEKSRRVSTSVDAVTALIREKLPGAGIDVSIRKGWAAAEVWLDDNEQISSAKTAPLALCIALLRAIKEGEHG